ncbi:hypothetical protein Mapa_013087 [Marchantia paleacea]|nr:hypothetical protein Mapa_013087 [Marchantia paleacea]
MSLSPFFNNPCPELHPSLTPLAHTASLRCCCFSNSPSAITYPRLRLQLSFCSVVL